jgi:hypothetical protein
MNILITIIIFLHVYLHINVMCKEIMSKKQSVYWGWRYYYKMTFSSVKMFVLQQLIIAFSIYLSIQLYPYTNIAKQINESQQIYNHQQ